VCRSAHFVACATNAALAAGCAAWISFGGLLDFAIDAISPRCTPSQLIGMLISKAASVISFFRLAFDPDGIVMVARVGPSYYCAPPPRGAVNRTPS
jgi:hypothetical protein